MDIQKQIVVTRARGNYMSRDKDKVDSQMHFKNADTMEAMLKVVEAAKRMNEVYPPMFAPNAVKQRFDLLNETLSDLEQP